MKATLSLVVLVGLVAACSSSKSSSSNNSTNPTGLSSNTQLSSLSGAQAVTVCQNIMAWEATYLVPTAQEALEQDCGDTAVTTTTNAADCHAAFTTCMSATVDAGTDAGTVTDAGGDAYGAACANIPSLGSCTITAGIVDQCLLEYEPTPAQYAIYTNGAICDQTFGDAATTVPDTGTTSDAQTPCDQVVANCPDLAASFTPSTH